MDKTPEDWQKLAGSLRNLARFYAPKWNSRGELTEQHMLVDRAAGSKVIAAGFVSDDTLVYVARKSDRFVISIADIDPKLGAGSQKFREVEVKGFANGAVLHPSGNFLAIATDHGGLEFFSTKDRNADGSPKKLFRAIPSDPACFAFSSDGSLLAVCSRQSVSRPDLKLYRVQEDMQLVGSYCVPETYAQIHQVAFNPAREELALSWSKISSSTMAVDLLALDHLAERNGLPKLLTRNDQVGGDGCLAFSPEGVLYSGSNHDWILRSADRDLSKLTAKKLSERTQGVEWSECFETTGPVGVISFTHGGLMCVGGDDGFPRLFDRESFWEDGSPAVIAFHKLKAGGSHCSVTAIAFSPDGRRLVVASSTGNVRVFEG